MVTDKDRKLDMLLLRCQLLDKSERYQELVPIVRELFQHAVDSQFLNLRIRNYFSVAYKHVTASLRSAWRALNVERNKFTDRDIQEYKIVEEYLIEIENELKGICDEVVDQIDKYVFLGSETATPESSPSIDNETRVYFLKMKGDYYRYKAEVSTGQALVIARDKAKNAYDLATQYSESLPCVNALKLGLALNFSVFYYEIDRSAEKACLLAKHAFDSAIKDIDAMSEVNYKESTLIMQLLRDNLSLWSSKDTQKDEE